MILNGFLQRRQRHRITRTDISSSYIHYLIWPCPALSRTERWPTYRFKPHQTVMIWLINNKLSPLFVSSPIVNPCFSIALRESPRNSNFSLGDQKVLICVSKSFALKYTEVTNSLKQQCYAIPCYIKEILMTFPVHWGIFLIFSALVIAIDYCNMKEVHTIRPSPIWLTFHSDCLWYFYQKLILKAQVHSLITARKQGCGKIMFLQVFVCPRGHHPPGTIPPMDCTPRVIPPRDHTPPTDT